LSDEHVGLNESRMRWINSLFVVSVLVFDDKDNRLGVFEIGSSEIVERFLN
jgi:hypothetical protein